MSTESMKDKDGNKGEALYRDGEESLFGGDVKNGIDLLTKSAELGNLSAADLLSKVYFTNEFGVEDDRMALKYAQIAANDGYVYSQCRLGYLLATGRGGKFDLKSAEEWLRRAVAAPWDCQFALAVLADVRNGVKISEAVEAHLDLLLRVVAVETNS